MTTDCRRDHDPARADLGFRQDRSRRVCPRAGRAAASSSCRPAARQGAQGCRRRRQGHRRAHRLSRDDGRPAQDAASQGARRAARHPRQRRARRAAAGARHRADRPAGGQPLPVRGDRGEGRAVRRLHREHRHRRPGHDPRGRQEPRRRHRGGRSRGLCPGAGRDDARSGGATSLGSAQGAGGQGLRAHRRLRCGDQRLVRRRAGRARAGLARVRRAGLAQELRYGENPHQRAAFYVDGRSAGRAWRPPCSTRARSCPTTTSTTPMPPSSWWPSSIPAPRRRSPSSSTPTPAAWRSAPRWPRPIAKALRCDPVSAFGGIIALNGRSMRRRRAEITGIFTEVVIAPDATRRGQGDLRRARRTCAC